MVMENIGALFSRVFDLFKWWIVIAPWEQAIRVRNGKKIKVLEAGIHFRIPGFDRFFVQSTRKRYMNTPTQAVTTSDGKAITISGGTSYSIASIGILYDTLHDPSNVIQTETQAVVAQYIAENELINCTPIKVQAHVNKSLDFGKYGLTDVEFFVTDFVAVKTYRIINSSPLDFNGGVLDTNYEKQ
jgi:hypothetical protein